MQALPSAHEETTFLPSTQFTTAAVPLHVGVKLALHSEASLVTQTPLDEQILFAPLLRQSESILHSAGFSSDCDPDGCSGSVQALAATNVPRRREANQIFFFIGNLHFLVVVRRNTIREIFDTPTLAHTQPLKCHIRQILQHIKACVQNFCQSVQCGVG